MICPKCKRERPDDSYREGKCPSCRSQLTYPWGDLPQLMVEGERLALVLKEGKNDQLLVFTHGVIGVCLDIAPSPNSRPHTVFVQVPEIERVLVGRNGDWTAVGPWIEAWPAFLKHFREKVTRALKSHEAYEAEKRTEALEFARAAFETDEVE